MIFMLFYMPVLISVAMLCAFIAYERRFSWRWFWTFLLFACLAASASAQSTYYSGQATIASRQVAPGQSAPILTLPYAKITVCIPASGSNVCNTAATIYSDPGLTQVLAQPFSADALGNYGFYAQAARYIANITTVSGYSAASIPQTAGGAVGATGCNVSTDPTCHNVVLPQPLTDQYASNTYFVYPAVIGGQDAGARINAYLRSATCQGPNTTGCTVHLMNAGVGLAALTTPIVIPATGTGNPGYGSKYTLECDKGGGFTYAGSGRAISITGASNYADIAVNNCIVVGTSAGVAGISMRDFDSSGNPAYAGVLGWTTRGNVVTGFTNGEGFEVGLVVGSSYDDTSTNNKYGILLVNDDGTGGAGGDSNDLKLYHFRTGANTKWGIYSPALTGYAGQVEIFGHLSEGDGAGTDADSGSASFEKFAGLDYVGRPYMEKAGPIGVKLGSTTSTGPFENAHISGVITSGASSIGVYVVKGNRVTIDPVQHAGVTGEQGVRLSANATHVSVTDSDVTYETGAPPVDRLNNPTETQVNRYMPGGGSAFWQVAARTFTQGGGCTIINPTGGFNTGSWAIDYSGGVQDSVGGGGSRFATTKITSANTTVGSNSGTYTLTVSVNSAGQLCGTLTGGTAGGTTVLDGTWNATGGGFGPAITADFNHVISPQIQSVWTPTSTTAACPAGQFGVGTGGALYYCKADGTGSLKLTGTTF